MSKMEEARAFLNEIGMPQKQQADICCLSLLAMSNITEEVLWENATNDWIRIHDIIAFSNSKYGTTYAENSRETFRKQAMHHFRTAALIEDNGTATNSPNYRYRLTNETLSTIKTIGSSRQNNALKRFLAHHQRLIDFYASKRRMTLRPVKINKKNFLFSPGKHNELQKAIIEGFAPRFAPNAECLYVGDTVKKDLVKDNERLKSLGFEITQHDKMPDIVLYCEDKKWIYFIEAVTSVGPMDQKRLSEINEMTTNVSAGKVFVTAFLDFRTFLKFCKNLAWETEVWIAEAPDHMIHLNGNKFLGPHKGSRSTGIRKQKRSSRKRV